MLDQIFVVFNGFTSVFDLKKISTIPLTPVSHQSYLTKNHNLLCKKIPKCPVYKDVYPYIFSVGTCDFFILFNNIMRPLCVKGISVNTVLLQKIERNLTKVT